MTERNCKVDLGKNLIVGRVGAKDLDNVWMVIKSASDWLSTRGMYHWANYYTKKG